MFAGIDRGSDMHRPKSWWRREDDDVDAALDDFLVRIQPRETTVRLHLELVGIRLLQARQRALELVLESIADCHQRHVSVRCHGLRGCATSASAAADQTDAQRLARRTLAAHRTGQDKWGRNRRGSGASNEFTSRF